MSEWKIQPVLWPLTLDVVICPFCDWSLCIPWPMYVPEEQADVEQVLQEHLDEHVEEMMSVR